MMDYCSNAIPKENSFDDHTCTLVVSFHLDVFSKAYALGGWNIKNLEWFSLALRTKSFWLVLNGVGLWS